MSLCGVHDVAVIPFSHCSANTESIKLHCFFFNNLPFFVLTLAVSQIIFCCSANLCCRSTKPTIEHLHAHKTVCRSAGKISPYVSISIRAQRVLSCARQISWPSFKPCSLSKLSRLSQNLPWPPRTSLPYLPTQVLLVEVLKIIIIYRFIRALPTKLLNQS